MALAFVECPGNSGKGATVVVTLSAANTGDLLVACTGSEDNQNPTISGSGWTEFERVVLGTTLQVKCWYKIAGASEPTSITFTYGVGVNNCGVVWRGTGADATPFNHDSGGATGTDVTAECGTAGGSGAAGKIAVAVFDNASTLSSWSSGYTNRGDFDSGNVSIYCADDLADGTAEAATCTVTGTIAGWVGTNSAWNAGTSAGAMNRHLQNMGAR
jgi:hypothetical protein